MSSYIKAIPVLQFSPPPPPSPPRFQPIPNPNEGGTASENPSSTVTYSSPPPPFTSTYEPPPPPATSTVTPILFSSPPPPLPPPPPPPSLPSPPPPLPSTPPLIPSSSSPPPVTEPSSIPPQLSPTLSPPHVPKPRIPPPPPLHIGRPSSHVNNSRIKHSPPPPSHRNNNGAMTGASASIAALAGLMMLSFVGAGIWFVRQKKRIPPPLVPDTTYQRTLSFPTTTRQSSGGYRFAYSITDPGLSSSISFFTYEDLSYMTNGFSSQNLLAQGGFGPVYRGMLQDGREVAIKQLKIGGAQGDREFRAEVDIISRVHHRHLVSLVGYCVLEQERLLVYDYVPNQTLYHHLHGLGSPIMDWATRVKIAVGAARGIAYLHEDCHPKIIHRDIKSSNILLDNNFEAQVSDFGLAKLVTDASSTHVSTRVMGTFGYLAPEYALTGKLTAKSDVYSFGVVLLELITGRKPVDVSQHIGDESLVEWARPLLNRALETGEIGELTDPRLEKRYNYREMFQIIEAAAACIRRTATLRPRMAQVVRALDSMSDSDLTNGIRPGVSGVINSGPNTEEIEIFRRSRFASQDYSSDLR